ncbi:MAG TPA: glycoside hydrolase, partial [Vicinamibacteria bacterium]|nr:glycoside hydrolase [Vicinamibacteria bacterium]
TRFNHTTGQVQDVSPAPLRTGQYRFNRTAPLIFSPVDPHILYLASQFLLTTRDGGHSWSTISPDLTREDPGVPPSLGHFADLAPGPHRGVIYTIAPSPRDANLIWVGTDDGLIQVTHDGGTTWRNVTPPSLTPWSKVSILEASHFDSDTAYAAINRLRLDDMKPHVLRTHNGGTSWEEVTAGLPEDEPVNAVREDPLQRGLLFAGTEGSVFASFDDGSHWQSLQLNLPHTSMRDLTIHGDDLVVGTHGRSFWILDDIAPLRQLKPEVASARVHLFTPADAVRIQRNQNTDTPLPPETPAGQNPPDGASIDYRLREVPKGPLTLEVLDDAGRLVRRFASDEAPPAPENDLNVPTYWVRPPRILPRAPGMHRFIWDLRYPPPSALDHEYPISAVPNDTPRGPLGPSVLPGRYTVRLTA